SRCLAFLPDGAQLQQSRHVEGFNETLERHLRQTLAAAAFGEHVVQLLACSLIRVVLGLLFCRSRRWRHFRLFLGLRIGGVLLWLRRSACNRRCLGSRRTRRWSRRFFLRPDIGSQVALRRKTTAVAYNEILFLVIHTSSIPS